MSLDVITNQQVIPSIESHVFEGHETSRLALGVVASGSEITPGLENEFNGYMLLRGHTYGMQKGFIPLDELNKDGSEKFDPDDERSIHFAVIENAMRSTRVVGAMRLIVKTSDHPEVLPVELHYPAVFAETGPSPVLSTESSRLISRHEDHNLSNSAKWALFAAGVSYVANNNLGPVYGVVERRLALGLKHEGIPLTELAEPEFIEDFNATKQPVRIDIPGLVQHFRQQKPGMLEAMKVLDKGFVYSGSVEKPIADQPAA